MHAVLEYREAVHPKASGIGYSSAGYQYLVEWEGVQEDGAQWPHDWLYTKQIIDKSLVREFRKIHQARPKRRWDLVGNQWV